MALNEFGYGTKRRRVVVAKLSPEFKDTAERLRGMLARQGIVVHGMPALSKKMAFMLNDMMDKNEMKKRRGVKINWNMKDLYDI